MTAQIIRPMDALKWINRRAGPIAALLLLIAAGIFVHRIALAQVEMISTLSAKMEPPAAERVQFVNYINTHPWFVLPYFAAFACGVLWMQFRQLPRWSLWLTFFLLALPILGYMWICFRLSTTAFFVAL
jgi:hypothetical protein